MKHRRLRMARRVDTRSVQCHSELHQTTHHPERYRAATRAMDPALGATYVFEMPDRQRYLRQSFADQPLFVVTVRCRANQKTVNRTRAPRVVVTG